MISINRLEEMAIEELQTELKNFKEQIKLQNNFIDSLLKATNNSEWLDKSMLDDEVSEVIEKIELDYEQLDQLKAENKELKEELEELKEENEYNETNAIEFKQTLTEIKEIAENGKRFAERWMITGEQKTNVLTYANAILQKISECEVK